MRSRNSAIVALAACAASVAGVLNDFVYDDIPIVRDNARLHELIHREILTRPYWPPPFVEQLYRPLASFSLAVQYVIGGGQPIVFRTVSYLLYAVAAVCFFRLATRLVSPRAALIAALLFAVHPVHVEAVALAVNQGELIVAILAMVAVGRYVDARRRGNLSRRDWSMIALLYAIALFTKESGFVLPLLLVASELIINDDDATIGDRLSRTWPGFALLLVVACAALLARAVVLAGSPIGASVAPALRGLSLGDRLLTMLQVVPMWLRLLAWPARLQADYAPTEITKRVLIGVPEVLGMALILAAFAALWLFRKRAPVVSFGLAWCIVALLPVSNIVPSGIVLAERTLFLPSVGFLVMVAGVASWLSSRPGWQNERARRALIASAGVLAVLGLLRSANRHHVWNSAHLTVRSDRTPP